MKTSTLAGDALDEAVALSLGYVVSGTAEAYGYTQWETPDRRILCHPFRPSEDWSEGGPIIEREGIGHDRIPTVAGVPREFCAWQYRDIEGTKPTARNYGPTPLVAAMRCFVISKLGDEVEVPDGLAGGPRH